MYIYNIFQHTAHKFVIMEETAHSLMCVLAVQDGQDMIATHVSTLIAYHITMYRIIYHVITYVCVYVMRTYYTYLANQSQSLVCTVHTYACIHNGNCQNKVTHVTRAGLRALGKFNSRGPQKLFIQKLLSIIQQFTCNINELLCMHAHTILIYNVCKKHGKLLLLCAYCCFCKLFHVLSYSKCVWSFNLYI